jgi:hypothetical protein
VRTATTVTSFSPVRDDTAGRVSPPGPETCKEKHSKRDLGKRLPARHAVLRCRNASFIQGVEDDARFELMRIGSGTRSGTTVRLRLNLVMIELENNNKQRRTHTWQ